SAVDRTLVVSLGCHLNAGTITEKTQKEMPKCPNAQMPKCPNCRHSLEQCCLSCLGRGFSRLWCNSPQIGDDRNTQAIRNNRALTRVVIRSTVSLSR
ncbi:MAG: hypothetical protein ACK57V_01850, partial [Pirellula sp.]